MSKVKIQGNASGTGIFTVAAPATNTDRTLTLPDVDATVLTTAGGTVDNQLTIKQSQGSAYGGWVTGLNLNGYFPGYDENSVRATIDSGIPNVGSLNTTYGWLGLATRGADGLNRRLVVDAAGNVTFPYQPVAALGVTANWTSLSTILWNQIHVNRGNCYNSTNGLFTCPVSGVYMVSIMAMSPGTNVTMDIETQKNGSSYQGLVPYQSDQGGSYNQVSGSTFISCSAGDTLSVKLNSGAIYGASGGRHGACSFALIG